MEEKLTFTTQKTIRLDNYLREVLPGCKSFSGQMLSNSKIRRLIIAGAVRINGRIVNRPAFELRGKSEITIALNTEKFFYEKQPDDINFEVTDAVVLYEDENLIFIDKPAFFPVEQTITGVRKNLHDEVVNYLWKKQPFLRNPPYVGIMHRLDRTTSGVIVFTKKRTVNAQISALFQTHELTKKYLAIVQVPVSFSSEALQQFLPGKSFSVEMFMGRISSKSQVAKWGAVPQTKGGQYSRTDFTVLKELNVEKYKCLLLECNLFTGRTHQIRVHLASKGLPVLGDTLYGGPPAMRIYLHSDYLAFKLGDKEYDVKSSSFDF